MTIMGEPLAVFDIDNTIYDGLSFFPLLESQIRAGIVDPAVLQNARAWRHPYTEGVVGYELYLRTLLDIYALGLAGRPVDEVQESTDDFFNGSDSFFKYAKPTIAQLKMSHHVTLVTGNTQFTAESVGRVIGAENSLSSVMEVKRERLTGRMATYLASRQEKLEAIEGLLQNHAFEGSLGFGDSEGDIEMLKSVDRAICVRPTPELRQIAMENSWTIVNESELASATGLLVVKNILETEL